jgi:hypothetical protein
MNGARLYASLIALNFSLSAWKFFLVEYGAKTPFTRDPAVDMKVASRVFLIVSL